MKASIIPLVLSPWLVRALNVPRKLLVPNIRAATLLILPRRLGRTPIILGNPRHRRWAFRTASLPVPTLPKPMGTGLPLKATVIRWFVGESRSAVRVSSVGMFVVLKTMPIFLLLASPPTNVLRLLPTGPTSQLVLKLPVTVRWSLPGLDMTMAVLCDPVTPVMTRLTGLLLRISIILLGCILLC